MLTFAFIQVRLNQLKVHDALKMKIYYIERRDVFKAYYIRCGDVLNLINRQNVSACLMSLQISIK